MANLPADWKSKNGVVDERRNGIEDIIAQNGVEFLEGQVEVGGFFDFGKESRRHKVEFGG